MWSEWLLGEFPITAIVFKRTDIVKINLKNFKKFLMLKVNEKSG